MRITHAGRTPLSQQMRKSVVNEEVTFGVPPKNHIRVSVCRFLGDGGAVVGASKVGGTYVFVSILDYVGDGEFKSRQGTTKGFIDVDEAVDAAAELWLREVKMEEAKAKAVRKILRRLKKSFPSGKTKAP
jgi:hypothetical protein